MIRRLGPVIFVLPLLVVLFLVLGFEWLRDGSDYEPPVGVTAEAALASPDGRDMGSVTLTQGPAGVIVAAEVLGLSPGGHAVSINAVGACEPDFEAAGDHFDPGEGGGGFHHDSWKKDEGVGPHGGDLPNLYANADGSARADFFTTGITLGTGADHSVFDDDGSAIIIYDEADTYSEDHGEGERVACGVIRLR